jgi:hypothetical protein
VSPKFQINLTTVENRLADLLSRWDLHSKISEEFLIHAQNNAWSEVVVEDELFFLKLLLKNSP